jgi:hypothetical protein
MIYSSPYKAKPIRMAQKVFNFMNPLQALQESPYPIPLLPYPLHEVPSDRIFIC